MGTVITHKCPTDSCSHFVHVSIVYTVHYLPAQWIASKSVYNVPHAWAELTRVFNQVHNFAIWVNNGAFFHFLIHWFIYEAKNLSNKRRLPQFSSCYQSNNKKNIIILGIFLGHKKWNILFDLLKWVFLLLFLIMRALAR